MERSRKERDLEALAVVIGCVVPFREAYRGSVEDEVNTKAVVAVERRLGGGQCEGRRIRN